MSAASSCHVAAAATYARRRTRPPSRTGSAEGFRGGMNQETLLGSSWETNYCMARSMVAWESENEQPFAEAMEDIVQALDRLERRHVRQTIACTSALSLDDLSIKSTGPSSPISTLSSELWSPAPRCNGTPPPSYKDSVADLPPDYTSPDALAIAQLPEFTPSSHLKSSICFNNSNHLRISHDTSPSPCLLFDEKSLYIDIDFGYSDSGIRSHAKKKAKGVAKKAPAASPGDDGEKKKEEGAAGGGDGGGDPPADGGAGSGDGGDGGGGDKGKKKTKKEKEEEERLKKEEEERAAKEEEERRAKEEEEERLAKEAEEEAERKRKEEEDAAAAAAAAETTQNTDDWAAIGATTGKKKKGKKGKAAEAAPPPPPPPPEPAAADPAFDDINLDDGSAPKIDINFGDTGASKSGFGLPGLGNSSSGWGGSGTDGANNANDGDDNPWGSDKKKDSSGFDFDFDTFKSSDPPAVAEEKLSKDIGLGSGTTTTKSKKKGKKGALIEEPVPEEPVPAPSAEPEAAKKDEEDPWDFTFGSTKEKKK